MSYLWRCRCGWGSPPYGWSCVSTSTHPWQYLVCDILTALVGVSDADLREQYADTKLIDKVLWFTYIQLYNDHFLFTILKLLWLTLYVCWSLTMRFMYTYCFLFPLSRWRLLWCRHYNGWRWCVHGLPSIVRRSCCWHSTQKISTLNLFWLNNFFAILSFEI